MRQEGEETRRRGDKKERRGCVRPGLLAGRVDGDGEADLEYTLCDYLCKCEMWTFLRTTTMMWRQK